MRNQTDLSRGKIPPVVIPSGARNLQAVTGLNEDRFPLRSEWQIGCFFRNYIACPELPTYFFFETAPAPKIRSSCFTMAAGCAASTSAVRRESVL